MVDLGQHGKLTEWKKGPAFEQEFDRTTGIGDFLQRYKGHEKGKDEFLGRYTALHMPDDPAGLKSRRLESLSKMRMVVAVIEQVKPAESGNLSLKNYVKRASFISDLPSKDSEGQETRGRFVLFKLPFSTILKTDCKTQLFPSQEDQYLEFEISSYPFMNYYGSDFEVAFAKMRAYERNQSVTSPDDDASEVVGPSKRPKRGHAPGNQDGPRGADGFLKRPIPSQISVVAATEAKAPNVRHHPEAVTCPPAIGTLSDFPASGSCVGGVITHHDDAEGIDSNQLDGFAVEESEDTQTYTVLVDMDFEEDSSTNFVSAERGMENGLNGRAASHDSSVGSTSSSLGADVVPAVPQPGVPSPPVPAIGEDHMSGQHERTAQGVASCSSKSSRPNLLPQLVELDAVYSALEQTSSAGGMGPYKVLAKQIHDNFAKMRGLMIAQGASVTTRRGDRLAGDDDCDESDGENEFNAEIWFKKCLDRSPFSGIRARNRQQLMELEALVTNGRNYRRVFAWIWRVYKACKQESYVNNMDVVAIVANCLICRFDCVVELTGRFSGPVPTQKEQLGDHKMLFDSTNFANISQLIHEIRAKALEKGKWDIQSTKTEKRTGQVNKTVTDTMATKWVKQHRGSVTTGLQYNDGSMTDMINWDLVEDARRESKRRMQHEDGLLNSYLLYRKDFSPKVRRQATGNTRRTTSPVRGVLAPGSRLNALQQANEMIRQGRNSIHPDDLN